MAKNGEEVNTKTLKLVKTDRELVEELREYVDAMVAKASELLARKMIMNISLDNGGQSGKVSLQAFRVEKVIEEYFSDEIKAARAQQQAQGGPR